MIVGMLAPQWSEAYSRFELSGRTVAASDEAARLGRGAEEIAAWLADDVRDAASAERWLRQFSSIKAGSEREGYQGTGNAHSVGVQGRLVYLECLYVDEFKVALTLDQMVDVLNHYIAFLKHKRGNMDHPPASFLVEFEREGDAALEAYSGSGGRMGWTKEEMAQANAKGKRDKRDSKLRALAENSKPHGR